MNKFGIKRKSQNFQAINFGKTYDNGVIGLGFFNAQLMAGNAKNDFRELS